MEKSEKLILGLDEAGRGPVLGPMVLSLVCCNEYELKDLERLDIKDSKKLSKNKREKIYNEIMDNFTVKSIILEAKDIDKYMIDKNINLNRIELMAFTKLINNLLKEKYGISIKNRKLPKNTSVKIYIDACSNNESAFSNQIISKLIANGNLSVIGEHKADDKYKIVSAASIVAKVLRDRIIENYKKIYGNIGSGYPSDKITMNYLKNYVIKNGDLPDIARKSWKTSRELLDNYGNLNKQRKLFEW